MNNTLNLKADFFNNKPDALELFFYAILPAILWHLIMSFSGFYLFEFAPFYSDELHYWNEINNFKEAGFQSGYSVINESPAKWNASPFGPHGPIFPTIYGALSTFLGWHLYSPVVFNTLVIVISYFLLLLTVEGDRENVYFTVVILSSFLPIFQFVFSGMQESVNYAVSLLIVSVILISFKKRLFIKNKYRQIFFEALAFLAFSAIRISWALVYAVLSVYGHHKPLTVRLLKLILAVLIVFVAVLWQRYSFSPISNEGQISLFLKAFFEFDKNAFSSFLTNISTNVFRFFNLNSKNDIIPFFYRAQLVLTVVYLAYLAIRAESKVYWHKRAAVTLFLILVSSIGVVVVLYQVGSWRDYRVLTPSLLVAYMMMPTIVHKRSALVTLCLVQMISTIIFMPTILEFRKFNYSADNQKISQTQEMISSKLIFDNNDNRWCNTMLLADTAFGKAIDSSIWRVPAGIGVSHVHNASKLELPLKSKYVFLSQPALQSVYYIEQLADRLIPFLSIEGQGVLFENQEAECFLSNNTS